MRKSILDKITDTALDASPLKAIAIVSGIAIVLFTTLGSLAVSVENSEIEEMNKNNCVQTQEMRTVPTIETGISSSGSVVTMTGQKIQFKYTCDDETRWR